MARKSERFTFYQQAAIAIRDSYRCQLCKKDLRGLRLEIDAYVVHLGTYEYEFPKTKGILACKECAENGKNFKLNDYENKEKILNQSQLAYFESFAKAIVKKGNFKMRYRETDDT